jgi:hypothetical protein
MSLVLTILHLPAIALKVVDVLAHVMEGFGVETALYDGIIDAAVKNGVPSVFYPRLGRVAR